MLGPTESKTSRPHKPLPKLRETLACWFVGCTRITPWYRGSPRCRRLPGVNTPPSPLEVASICLKHLEMCETPPLSATAGKMCQMSGGYTNHAPMGAASPLSHYSKTLTEKQKKNKCRVRTATTWTHPNVHTKKIQRTRPGKETSWGRGCAIHPLRAQSQSLGPWMG